jgi:hypothetical protein
LNSRSGILGHSGLGQWPIATVLTLIDMVDEPLETEFIVDVRLGELIEDGAARAIAADAIVDDVAVYLKGNW